MKLFISVSAASKKKGSNRSKFLSELMKRASGDLGNALADAFAEGDIDKFNKHFDGLKSKITKTMSDK